MEEDLSRIKNELQGSPLFQLSLTNKELFHSNFLAWFGNKYHNEFQGLLNQLLGEGSCPDDFSIDREFEHFDICIKDSSNNPVIIIENKVKSVPTKKQLDEYRSKIKSKNCRFILLTMTSNLHDMTKAEDWSIVTYKDLSDKLADVTISDSYHTQLLKDYREYVDNLQQIIVLFDAEESYFSGYECIKVDLGIHDICGKRKAQMLFQKLKLNCEKSWNVVTNETELTYDNIMVNWGFTNLPLVEVKLKTKYDDIIIIQIQGKQYRHAVEYFDTSIGERIGFDKNQKYPFMPNTKGLNYLANRYSFILSLNPDSNSIDLDSKPNNYPFTSKKFGQNKQPGYCRYCNGKIGKNNKISCFVYQWIEIPKEITMNELVDYIVSDTKNMNDFRNQL